MIYLSDLRVATKKKSINRNVTLLQVACADLMGVLLIVTKKVTHGWKIAKRILLSHHIK